MATLTETIAQELLAAADEPSRLDAVLRQYGHSKGPLYHALAQATALLTERLTGLSHESKEAEKECRERQQHLRVAEQELASMEQGWATKAQELTAIDERLQERQELLDQANKLACLGFGLTELSRLRDLLAQVAASQGAPPEEGVAQFFHTVERYERIVSLDLEANRAEAKTAQARAEADRWEAEARRKEARSKARAETIDLVQRWLSHGVREQDLPGWDKVLQKSHIPPEALESYGSLATLCQDRGEQAGKLESQVKEAEARLKPLQREEAQVRAGIAATRDVALQEMEKLSQQARQHLATLLAKAQEYGELQRQAATLEGELALARAFTSDEADYWAQVPRRAIQQLMVGLVLWARSGDHNQQVIPPDMVCQRTLLTRWHRVSLKDLLLWVCTAVLSEQEQKALASGR